MPLLYDRNSKKVTNVDDNLVTEAVNSGRYAFRSGVRVPVVDQDGNVGTIISDESPEAFKNGYRFLTTKEGASQAKEKIAEIKREEYGGLKGQTIAGALGAARTATFGGSDVGLRAVGLADEAREFKEENPLSSIAGEVAGVFVPGGAASLVAKAGVKAAQAAKGAMAARAGVAATELGMGARAAASLAGGAAEGALGGVQQTISEAALGDPELSTEKALANVGLGALFGGALTGGGRLTLDAGNKAVTEGLKAMAESQAIPKTAKEFAGRLSEIYGKAANYVRMDTQPDEIAQKLWDRGSGDFRKRVIEKMQNPQKMLDDVAARFEPVLAAEEALEDVIGRSTQIQRELASINFKQVTGIPDNLSGKTLAAAEKKSGRTVIQDAVDDGIEILTSMSRKANKMMDDNAEFPGMYDPGLIKAIRIITNDAEGQLTKATEIGEVASIIQNVKTRLGSEGKIFPKAKQLIGMSDARQRSNEVGQEIYHRLREHTVNEGLYGKLGTEIAKANDAFTVIKNANESYRELFFKLKDRVVDVENVEGASRATRKGIQKKWEVNKSNVNRFIQDQSSVANEERGLAIETMQEAMEQAIKDLDGLKLLKGPNSKEANDLLREFNDQVATAKQQAETSLRLMKEGLQVSEEVTAATRWLNAKESFTGKSLYGLGIGALAGAAGEDLTGIDTTTFTLGGAVAGALLGNPRAAIKWIHNLENLSGALDKRAQYAAQRFAALDTSLAQGVAQKVGQAARVATVRQGITLLDGSRKGNDEKTYDAHVQEMNDLQGDPLRMIDRVHEKLGGEVVTTSPVSTQAAIETTQRAVAFLQSKLPRDPLPTGMYANTYTPSSVELSKYANYVRAVMHPDEIFKELKNGSLNYETVEAVRDVYPNVFAKVQSAVLESLKTPDKVSYDKRVQLGILFNEPTVPALTPEYLRYLQGLNTVANVEAEQARNRIKGNAPGLRQISMSQREISDTAMNAERR